MNHLNSVLLEGIVTDEIIPHVSRGDFAEVQFEIMSVRTVKEAQPGSTIGEVVKEKSFITVYARGKLAVKLGETVRIDDQVRVVGRIDAPWRKPVVVVAEHVETRFR